RMITAIYPGTYDPVTNGHVDVIHRAAGIFDRVVVGVVGAPHHKQPMFSVEERVDFLRQALQGIDNVEVDVFRELVVEFARKWDAKVIVKGLRVISDFEWEFQMNQLNRTLAPDIETVYVMASPEVSFVSSSGVKEIAAYGGDIAGLVPDLVATRMRELFPAGPRALPSAPLSRLPGHGRPRSHRQARRPRPQREGRSAHRPGADRPRGDLRDPRPDARDDSRGDQAGPLDRQGTTGDARRSQARVRSDPRRGAGASGPRGVADRDRQARRAAGPGDHRRVAAAGPRDAARDGGLGRQHPVDARGQSRQVPRRGQAPSRGAARALAGNCRRGCRGGELKRRSAIRVELSAY